jgi:hypothetical protein
MMEDVPNGDPKVFTDRLRKINSYFQYFPVSETRDLKKETRFKVTQHEPWLHNSSCTSFVNPNH